MRMLSTKKPRLTPIEKRGCGECIYRNVKCNHNWENSEYSSTDLSNPPEDRVRLTNYLRGVSMACATLLLFPLMIAGELFVIAAVLLDKLVHELPLVETVFQMSMTVVYGAVLLKLFCIFTKYFDMSIDETYGCRAGLFNKCKIYVRGENAIKVNERLGVVLIKCKFIPAIADSGECPPT